MSANANSDPADLPAMYSVGQLKPLLQALKAAKSGDFSIRLPQSEDVLLSEICDAFNDLQSEREQTRLQAELVLQTELREAEVYRHQLAADLERKHTDELVKRQYAFLRDVLASVTEGRLLLKENRQDLPSALPILISMIPLSPHGAIRDLRASVQDASLKTGLSDQRWQDLVSAVSEAAMNAIVHATGGISRVYSDPAGIVQVWIEDTGAGISLENIPRATLERGYTTAGTMGHGFWMMLETVDRIYLTTGPDGTVIVLEQECVHPLPPWLRD